MADEPRERAMRALAGLGLPDAGLRELGAGCDHAAFTAGDLVVRVVTTGPTDAVVREARLLRVLAGRLPVVVPGPRVVDADNGVLAHRMLPGRSLLGRPAPAGAARLLGRLLRDLHAVPSDVVDGLMPVDPADPHDWLDELTGPSSLLRTLAETRPRATDVLVPAHADLGAEHILEDDGVLTGIIDWSDAAVTDPALDFARLYRDFGPAFLDEALAAYGGVDDGFRDRVTFFARCAALEDVVYGATPERAVYRGAAERSFAWLFPWWMPAGRDLTWRP